MQRHASANALRQPRANYVDVASAEWYGCPVVLTTRSTVRPLGRMPRGEQDVMAVMGSSTIRLLQSPTLTPVNPAMAACTAFCPSIMQYMLSAALAGTLRIMYDLHSDIVTHGDHT